MKTNERWQDLVRSLRERNWTGAIRDIDGIIDSDRANPNLYLKRGDICLKAGDKPEAVNSYLRAAWYLSKEGFLKKALAAYKLALRYDPDNDEALHESNKIMMEIESIADAPKKADWMIFAPEEPAGRAVQETEQSKDPNTRAGQSRARVAGNIPVTPLGFLSYFTESEIREILGCSIVRKFSDREPVVHEGDSGDSVYIIKSGSAYVVSHFFGKMLLLETLSAGDLFGEMAFLTGRTRTASVVAKGDLVVYEIRRELLDELVEKRPQILSQLSAIYINRVKDTLKKVRGKKQS